MNTIMNVLSGISTMADGVSYATQIAQTSVLKRSLNNLDVAVQKGDLTSADSILTGFIKANPQYATTSGTDPESQNPINQGFQDLADAISNNDVDGATSAWEQVKSQMADSGVKDLNDGDSATAKLLAQSKASTDKQILSDTLSLSSGAELSLPSLLGGTSDSSNMAGLSDSLISAWLSYRSSGQTSSSTSADSAGTKLDTAA